MRDTTIPVVAAVAVLGALSGLSQEWHNDWELKRSSSADKVHFRITRNKEGSNWSNSSDVPLSRFRGLPAATIDGRGSAKFDYVSDSGTLRCEGMFTSGRGSGTFVFEPNRGFSAELGKLGYDAPDDDELFGMMMSDVTLEFAKGVKNAGLNASTRQLVELRIHGVSLDYIEGVRAAGFKDLQAREFVEMKIHGVGIDFIRDLQRAGYNVSARQIVEMKIHGVSSDYLRDLAAYGVKPEPRELVELKIHGVSPEFLRDTKNLGYSFSARELVELKIHGVDGAYLKKLQDAGMKNLNARQIAQLKIHGVD